LKNKKKVLIWNFSPYKAKISKASLHSNELKAKKNIALGIERLKIFVKEGVEI
jgi:hypothetical protein